MRRFFLLAFSLGLVLWPRVGHAAPCASGTDCDGDGVDNFRDTCPALVTDTAPPAGTASPDAQVNGFQDISCYRPFLPTTQACIPVLARPFDEAVPDDPY